MLYDRELAVSERRVKPADILHNASLILGKQTIHILPEGYPPLCELNFEVHKLMVTQFGNVEPRQAQLLSRFLKNAGHIANSHQPDKPDFDRAAPL